MNCDQIIYLGIFAIVAIYLYQNVLTPTRVEYFTPGEEPAPPIKPMQEDMTRPHSVGPPNPDAVARANENAKAVIDAQARANRANSVVAPSDPVEPESEVRASRFRK